jgi:hypothetical protein
MKGSDGRRYRWELNHEGTRSQRQPVPSCMWGSQDLDEGEEQGKRAKNATTGESIEIEATMGVIKS